MILEGNLGAFPFEDILKHVRDRSQSGTLEIDCPGGNRRLLFQNGRLVFLCDFQDFAWLGRGLLGAGVIDREDYYHLLDETEGSSAEALRRLATTRGPEMAERLPGVLQAALDDEILLLARTESGAFRLSADLSDIPPQLRLDVPVQDALARCQELSARCRELLARHPGIEAAVLETDSIAERSFHDVTLSSQQWSILAAVNGHRRASDLVSLSGLGYWQVLLALGRLLELGLVRPRKQDTDYSFPAIQLEEPDTPPAGNGKGGRNWLLFRTGEEEKAPHSGPEALASLCNRLLEKLAEDAAAEDAEWLPRRWSRLVSRYPLADMVVVNHRRVYVGGFARMRERFEGGEAENAALEETERALAQLALGAQERLLHRLGARKAVVFYAKAYSSTLVGERSPLTATRLAQLGLPAPGAKS